MTRRVSSALLSLLLLAGSTGLACGKYGKPQRIRTKAALSAGPQAVEVEARAEAAADSDDATRKPIKP